MSLCTDTSNGPTVCRDRLNMEYYNNDNMGQWHYSKKKENKLLNKSNIPIPNLEANTSNHIEILKNILIFSYIYIYIYIYTHIYQNWTVTAVQHVRTGQ